MLQKIIDGFDITKPFRFVCIPVWIAIVLFLLTTSSFEDLGIFPSITDKKSMKQEIDEYDAYINRNINKAVFRSSKIDNGSAEQNLILKISDSKNRVYFSTILVLVPSFITFLYLIFCTINLTLYFSLDASNNILIKSNKIFIGTSIGYNSLLLVFGGKVIWSLI